MPHIAPDTDPTADAPPPALDLDFVRAQFPAFDTVELRDQAFFENAGGSYTCRQVIDRLKRFYTQRKVQPYAPYAAARLGGDEMDEAQTRLAALLGIAPEELNFGPSTTQNVYVLAQAFRQSLPHDAAIIVTDQDHEANSGPWRRLAEDGIEIREWRMRHETGHLAPEDLAALLDDRVALVCFPHCSNVVGEINPVPEIVAMAHDAGAVTCVDGVSYAPHGFPDIGALGTDIYLFSAYKTYGPHQGVMALRRALAERLPNQGHWFNAGTLTKRFTPAGPDHAQVAAAAGMVDYVDALATHHRVAQGQIPSLMQAQEKRLLAPLLDWLSARNDLRLLGPSDAARRAPTVALDLGRPADPVAADLAAHGIMAGGGDFYAGRALSAMGVAPENGVLRLSFTHYTSEADLARLTAALGAVL